MLAQANWFSITVCAFLLHAILYLEFLFLQSYCPIADVAISKRPLLFTVWTQHLNFYEIFTRKQVLPTSAGNAQAQLHSCG